jgi:hypothetical protein
VTAPTPSPDLRPSEAIAAAIPLIDHQIFGLYFAPPTEGTDEYEINYDEDQPTRHEIEQNLEPGQKICACFLGALAIGWNLDNGDDASTELDHRAAKSGSRYASNPARPSKSVDVVSAVGLELNDTHHWPLEKIASWLEGLGL